MPYTLTRDLVGANPALTANRTYQGSRDALHSIENKAGTPLVSGYTYAVNSLGQRQNVTTSGSAFDANQPANWIWGYDSLGQLTTADSPTAARDRAYQYDPIGNREKFAHGTTTLPTNNNYAANALNQYSQVRSYTPQPVHDLDGNLTRGPVPGLNGNLAGVTAPADATEIKWDAENRMISCQIAGITYYYGYDHLSRQMGRGETTALNRRYYYDGWNRIAEYTTLWTPHNTFTWGLDLSGTMQGAGGVGGLLVMRWVSEVGTPDYFPTYDGNGNVSEYLDTAGATVVHYEYDPFGGLTRLTGNNSGRFQHRFSTKPRDFSTGLYNYGYRWYDPFTGRWPSRDPIGEEGGLNLYGFVRNNGVDWVDYFGLWFVDGTALKRDEIDAGGTIYVNNGKYDKYVDKDGLKNLPKAITAAENHEDRHISAAKASKDAHAIPYKQVFCINAGGVKKWYFYSRQGGTLERIEYIKGMVHTWHFDARIQYTTFEEERTEEKKEISVEITELEKVTGSDFITKRISLTLKPLLEYYTTGAGSKKTGSTENWKSFKEAYEKEKKKAKDEKYDFSWVKPETIYNELK